LRFRINAIWAFVIPHFISTPIFHSKDKNQDSQVLEAVLIRITRIWLGLSTNISKETVFWMLGTNPNRIRDFTLDLANRGEKQANIAKPLFDPDSPKFIGPATTIIDII
jgi:hypothetical protein